MTLTCQPCREPLRATVMRTGIIALIVGAVLALRSGELSRWPLATLLVLWPAFGGHWVELFFLNWLRPQLPDARLVQVAARIATWFVGGTVLAMGMVLTARALTDHPQMRWLVWWVGGVGFIGIELIVHLALQLRGRPNFYNGRG